MPCALTSEAGELVAARMPLDRQKLPPEGQRERVTQDKAWDVPAKALIRLHFQPGQAPGHPGVFRVPSPVLPGCIGEAGRAAKGGNPPL